VGTGEGPEIFVFCVSEDTLEKHEKFSNAFPGSGKGLSQKNSQILNGVSKDKEKVRKTFMQRNKS